MGELVQICDDLYESHTQIILFMAVDIAVNFKQMISKLPEHASRNLHTLVQRCWVICARCHHILVGRNLNTTRVIKKTETNCS